MPTEVFCSLRAWDEAAEEPAIAFMAAAAALRVTTPQAQLLSASQFASATSPREYRLGPASPAVQ